FEERSHIFRIDDIKSLLALKRACRLPRESSPSFRPIFPPARRRISFQSSHLIPCLESAFLGPAHYKSPSRDAIFSRSPAPPTGRFAGRGGPSDPPGDSGDFDS